MSYDIYLRAEPCPTCKRDGDEPERLDPTYNLTPIFDAALTGESLPNPDVGEAGVVLFGEKTDRPRGLRLLSGRKAKDTIDWLRKAHGHLLDPDQREKFTALEPENKWGTVDGAVWVIAKMIENAEQYPDNVWHIR
jgi:hypothetical protein